MSKWCVEFDGSVEVEADDEEEALQLAWERLNEDPANVLMANADRDEENDDDEEDDDEED